MYQVDARHPNRVDERSTKELLGGSITPLDSTVQINDNDHVRKLVEEALEDVRIDPNSRTVSHARTTSKHAVNIDVSRRQL